MGVDFEPGAEFAGHRIVAPLGRGGMGVVYHAVHLGLERDVALKVIAADRAIDPGFRERFRREARSAAALDHPGVITIYEAGVVEDLPYMTMRLVRGPDLGRQLRIGGPLTPEVAAGVVALVADALETAHEAGLVHRDIKPANILLERRGRQLRALLADFGLARLAEGSSALTTTGSWLGTVDYAPPETLAGEPATAASDVYALGAVLHAALTGRPPFARETAAAVIWAHAHEPPPPLAEIEHPSAAALDEVIARAMAKSPGDRYAGAGELADAVRAATGPPTELPLLAQPLALMGELASEITTDPLGSGLTTTERAPDVTRPATPRGGPAGWAGKTPPGATESGEAGGRGAARGQGADAAPPEQDADAAPRGQDADAAARRQGADAAARAAGRRRGGARAGRRRGSAQAGRRRRGARTGAKRGAAQARRERGAEPPSATRRAGAVERRVRGAVPRVRCRRGAHTAGRRAARRGRRGARGRTVGGRPTRGGRRRGVRAAWMARRRALLGAVAAVVVVAGAALFILLSRDEVSALEATRLIVDPIPVAAAPVGLASADDGTPWVLTTDGEVGFVRPIEDDKAGDELHARRPGVLAREHRPRSVGHDRGRGGAHRPGGPAGARRAGRPRVGQRQRDRLRRGGAVGVRHHRQRRHPRRSGDRAGGRRSDRGRARRCAPRSWPARARSGCCAGTLTPTPTS